MYLNRLDELEEKSKIYIYGAGTHGYCLYQSVKFYRPDITVLGFLDSYKSGELSTIPIYSIDQFSNSQNIYNYILIATNTNYWDGIRDILKNNNIKNYLYNTFYDFDIYGNKKVNKFDSFKKHVSSVEKIFSLKKDILTWKIIVEAMRNYSIKTILDYFIEKEIKVNMKDDYLMGMDLNDDDIVINGGAFFGSDTIDFAKAVRNGGTVYAFDPLAKMDNQFSDCELNNIKVIPQALWENKTNLYFTNSSSRTTVKTDKSKGHTKIKAISIDEFIIENKINNFDFLKLDVEGAELQVLKGGKESIKKFRPKLAISIYHKLEHYFEIPMYLNKMLSNYSYHLSLNNPYTIGTVIYGIPN